MRSKGAGLGGGKVREVLRTFLFSHRSAARSRSPYLPRYTCSRLNPTYRNHGQHVEVIEVTYDEEVVSFAQLTAIFWYNVDPLNGNGQFCDNGHSYLSVLFYYTTEEQVIALGTFAVPRSAARCGPWWTVAVRGLR